MNIESPSSLITEIQRLSLKPGDVLVLKVDRQISDEVSQRLKANMLEHIEPLLPGVKCIVLGAELSFEVITHDEAEPK